MYNTQEIVTLLEAIASVKKISINKLLQGSGLDKNVIYRMKAQNQMPSVDKIVKIADYLDCSVDYLLGRTDIPDNPNLKSQDKEECLV